MKSIFVFSELCFVNNINVTRTFAKRHAASASISPKSTGRRFPGALTFLYSFKMLVPHQHQHHKISLLLSFFSLCVCDAFKKLLKTTQTRESEKVREIIRSIEKRKRKEKGKRKSPYLALYQKRSPTDQLDLILRHFFLSLEKQKYGRGLLGSECHRHVTFFLHRKF